MKQLTAAAFLFAFLLTVSAGSPAHDAPTEIGGFKLGDFITEYSEIEYSDYLKNVVVTDWHGFRKGIISYGVCAYPGQIVDILMKYEDPSKEFYGELLKKFKSKYGKPDEWNGDAFGVIYVWKWRFVDKNNRHINLILRHDLQSDQENIGNMVKLSYPELIEEERLCFVKFCEENRTTEEKKTIKQRIEPDWDYMIPR